MNNDLNIWQVENMNDISINDKVVFICKELWFYESDIFPDYSKKWNDETMEWDYEDEIVRNIKTRLRIENGWINPMILLKIGVDLLWLNWYEYISWLYRLCISSDSIDGVVISTWDDIKKLTYNRS